MIKDRVTIRIVLSDGFVIRINGEIANREELEQHLGGVKDPIDQLVFYNQEYKDEKSIFQKDNNGGSM